MITASTLDHEENANSVKSLHVHIFMINYSGNNVCSTSI